jgi:glucosamine kinase
MILIADSGSTKSNWMILKNDNSSINLNTIGFNPYFHDSENIAKEIRKNETLLGYAPKVKELYFYGSGCSTVALCNIVKNGLQAVFVNAEIEVGHDLKACAYATYQGEPAISCILGTGSNSCYFDGEKVTEGQPPLAFILGDEGSGSYYGKQLLNKFLYKQLPPHIQEDFFNEYQLTKDEVNENVYFKAHPNVYIASFMKFLSRHPNDPFVVEMLREGMTRFLVCHVLCFPQAREVKVNFVGSVAFYFEDILRSVAQELGVKVGNVIKKPIDGLVAYHLKKRSMVTAKRAK